MAERLRNRCAGKGDGGVTHSPHTTEMLRYPRGADHASGVRIRTDTGVSMDPLTVRMGQL